MASGLPFETFKALGQGYYVHKVSNPNPLPPTPKALYSWAAVPALNPNPKP